jgi:hypothetical protein
MRCELYDMTRDRVLWSGADLDTMIRAADGVLDLDDIGELKAGRPVRIGPSVDGQLELELRPYMLLGDGMRLQFGQHVAVDVHGARGRATVAGFVWSHGFPMVQLHRLLVDPGVTCPRATLDRLHREGAWGHEVRPC